jgi:DNA-binding ferritin-like protein (Dps family)
MRPPHTAACIAPPAGGLQELKAKEQVAAFKLEISGLTKLLEQGAAVGLAEEADLEELIRQKEEAAAERDIQVEQIVGLRNDVAAFSDRLRTAEVEKASLEAEIQVSSEQAPAAACPCACALVGSARGVLAPASVPQLHKAHGLLLFYCR